MRTIVCTLIFVICFVGLGMTMANAQFTKNTGLFEPRKDSPVILKVDDKRTLYMANHDTEEWIFCVITTPYGDRLDGVILMKTARTEYADRCPIMLVISGATEGENSIDLSVGLGEAQQSIKLPILYLPKNDQCHKWLRRGYKRMVLNQQTEEVSHYQ